MEWMMQVLEAGGFASFTFLVVAKTTLLLAIAAGVAWTFRGQSAAVRHSIWAIAAIGVLSLPLASAKLRVGVPLLPSQDIAREVASAGVRSGDGGIVEFASGAQSETLERSSATAAQTSSAVASTRVWNVGQMLLGAWAIVALGLLARIFGGVVSLRRIARRATSLAGSPECRILDQVRDDADVTRPVRLIRSEWSDVPMTWGAFRPVVHLPATSTEWSEDRLRVVLEHEMAHVRRWDVLTLALARAVTALHWFNPMAWMAERSLREEAERASDDWVLRWGAVPSAYAEHLLELARGHMPGRLPATALPMAHRSRFEGRLMAILHPSTDRRSVSMKTWIATGVVAGLAFSVLAAAVPVAATATDAEPAPLFDNTASDVLAESSVAAILDDAFPLPEGTDISAVEQSRANATTAQEVSEADRARLEDPRSVAALSKALLEDTEVEVRRIAAWALGQIEDPAATQVLIRALESDADVEVRKTVVWALGQLEDRRAVQSLFGALGDADVDVRSQAAWALGQIGAEEAVPGLLDALDDPEPKVRGQAVWALGQIESADAVLGLVGVLGDPDPETRSQAAWALGQIESDRAVTALVTALDDENAEVRSQAAWALGQIESANALEGLLRALTVDEVADVRSQAAWAIGQIEPTSAPRALLDAMSDSDADVREQALWAVRQIEDPASVDAVVALLASDDLNLKIDALDVLAGIRNEAAIEAIAELMSSASPEVRAAAARALAGRGGWDSNPRPRPRPAPRPRPRPQGNVDAGSGL